MMSIEMFTQQLDMLLEKRKEIAVEQEAICCELVDEQKPIECFDINVFQAFAKIHDLEIEVHEEQPHPLRSSVYYKVKYKGVQIITYPEEQERCIMEQASPMEQRMEAYASAFIGKAV